jgi:hypothetical protein
MCGIEHKDGVPARKDATVPECCAPQSIHAQKFIGCPEIRLRKISKES